MRIKRSSDGTLRDGFYKANIDMVLADWAFWMAGCNLRESARPIQACLLWRTLLLASGFIVAIGLGLEKFKAPGFARCDYLDISRDIRLYIKPF
tara:strand:+ start:211 stop:492 length:282 start_codon:yes stop_codon:yes gene_type:complete